VAFGLLLALAGELSWLSLVIPKTAFLIPFTRWLGFVWLIVAGFKLPKTTAANAIADPGPVSGCEKEDRSGQ
jgi:hypothetical protein